MGRSFCLVLPAVVAVTMALTLGLCAALAPDPGTVAQNHELRLSKEYMPKVQAHLQGNPHFADVEVGTVSWHGGLGLTGYVETPDDLFRLMRVIAAERLPVAVHWDVRVRAEEIGR